MANPYASVVIVTTSEPKSVLKDLENQFFKDFEVIIASEAGIVNAVNSALERARGTIMVRIDDDVQLPPTWLQELLIAFKDPFVAGTTGPTYVPKTKRQNRDSIRIWEKPNFILRWLTDFSKFCPAKIHRCGVVSYDSNYAERFPKDMPMFECDHLEGTNWAMRTDLIKLVGGFDPEFDGVCEWYDTDLEQKIKKIGYRLVYNPKAYLWHWLEKGEHYNERFDGESRIKNFRLYHQRHSKPCWKRELFIQLWKGYFLWKSAS